LIAGGLSIRFITSPIGVGDFTVTAHKEAKHRLAGIVKWFLSFADIRLSIPASSTVTRLKSGFLRWWDRRSTWRRD